MRDPICPARPQLLANDELREAACLVFANKQDVRGAMSTTEMCNKLGLHSLRQRNWYIQATSAVTGDGLYEGLDWLSTAVCGGK